MDSSLSAIPANVRRSVRTWPLMPGLVVLAAAISHSWQPSSASGQDTGRPAMLNREAWEFSQAGSFGSAGLVRFALSHESLDAARPNFGDLRLIDPENREVSLVVAVPRPGMPESEAVNAADHALRIAVEGNETRITFRSSRTLDVRSVAIATPASEFLKPARLIVEHGSPPGERLLASGVPLYRQRQGSENLEIAAPGVPPDAAVTIILDDARSEAIPISGVTLHGSRPDPFPPEPVPLRIIERVDRDDRTRLLLDFGSSHLHVAALEFAVKTETFLRDVELVDDFIAEGEVRERALHSGAIGREGTGVVDPKPARLGVEKQLPRRSHWIVIHNGDSPPLEITSVTALVRPVHGVALITAPGEHRLLSGNPAAERPRYDLARMDGEIARLPLDSGIAFGPLERNADWTPPDPLRGIPSLGTAIDTEDWAFRKSVRAMAAGVVGFSLDLEALAGARSDLGDLRLVRDGRQAPFVIDRKRAMPASIPLEAEFETDAERPSVTRWILRLPRAALPVAEVSCVSSTPLFDRRVTVLESVDDRRGGTSQRTLGQADWAQSPGAPRETRFVVRLSARPTTGQLVLEIDNGDNPPVEFSDFHATANGARVLFLADSPGEWLLCYGNPKASRPAYDLGAMTAAMIDGDPAAATLGPEIQVAAVPWSASRPLTGVRRWIFWGALLVVAAGLLFIIARLLPGEPTAKPPAGGAGR